LTYEIIVHIPFENITKHRIQEIHLWLSLPNRKTHTQWKRKRKAKYINKILTLQRKNKIQLNSIPFLFINPKLDLIFRKKKKVMSTKQNKIHCQLLLF